MLAPSKNNTLSTIILAVIVTCIWTESFAQSYTTFTENGETTTITTSPNGEVTYTTTDESNSTTTYTDNGSTVTTNTETGESTTGLSNFTRNRVNTVRKRMGVAHFEYQMDFENNPAVMNSQGLIRLLNAMNMDTAVIWINDGFDMSKKDKWQNATSITEKDCPDYKSVVAEGKFIEVPHDQIKYCNLINVIRDAKAEGKDKQVIAMLDMPHKKIKNRWTYPLFAQAGDDDFDKKTGELIRNAKARDIFFDLMLDAGRELSRLSTKYPALHGMGFDDFNSIICSPGYHEGTKTYYDYFKGDFCWTPQMIQEFQTASKTCDGCNPNFKFIPILYLHNAFDNFYESHGMGSFSWGALWNSERSVADRRNNGHELTGKDVATTTYNFNSQSQSNKAILKFKTYDHNATGYCSDPELVQRARTDLYKWDTSMIESTCGQPQNSRRDQVKFEISVNDKVIDTINPYHSFPKESAIEKHEYDLTDRLCSSGSCSSTAQIKFRTYVSYSYGAEDLALHLFDVELGDGSSAKWEKQPEISDTEASHVPEETYNKDNMNEERFFVSKSVGSRTNKGRIVSKSSKEFNVAKILDGALAFYLGPVHFLGDLDDFKEQYQYFTKNLHPNFELYIGLYGHIYNRFWNQETNSKRVKWLKDQKQVTGVVYWNPVLDPISRGKAIFSRPSRLPANYGYHSHLMMRYPGLKTCIHNWYQSMTTPYTIDRPVWVSMNLGFGNAKDFFELKVLNEDKEVLFDTQVDEPEKKDGTYRYFWYYHDPAVDGEKLTFQYYNKAGCVTVSNLALISLYEAEGESKDGISFVHNTPPSGSNDIRVDYVGMRFGKEFNKWSDYPHQNAWGFQSSTNSQYHVKSACQIRDDVIEFLELPEESAVKLDFFGNGKDICPTYDEGYLEGYKSF